MCPTTKGVKSTVFSYQLCVKRTLVNGATLNHRHQSNKNLPSSLVLHFITFGHCFHMNSNHYAALRPVIVLLCFFTSFFLSFFLYCFIAHTSLSLLYVILWHFCISFYWWNFFCASFIWINSNISSLYIFPRLSPKASGEKVTWMRNRRTGSSISVGPCEAVCG